VQLARKGRPATALGTLRTSAKPLQLRAPFAAAAPADNLTGLRRPVSRHRPPPESLDLQAAHW
jgi:hypothetical protein